MPFGVGGQWARFFTHGSGEPRPTQLAGTVFQGAFSYFLGTLGRTLQAMALGITEVLRNLPADVGLRPRAALVRVLGKVTPIA